VRYAWKKVKINEHAFMACCSRSDCKSKNEIVRVEDEIVTPTPIHITAHTCGTCSSLVQGNSHHSGGAWVQRSIKNESPVQKEVF